MALDIMQIVFITIVTLLYVVVVFFVFLCCFFFLWGGGTQMFLYTVFSHFSFSSCATHYETFPLEKEWMNKCVQKPKALGLLFFSGFFFFNVCGGVEM